MGNWLDTLDLWHWLGLSAILLAAGLAGRTARLSGVALAALLTGLVLAVGPAFSWTIQLFLFFTFAVVFSLLQRRRQTGTPSKPDHWKDMAALMGQTFVLQHSLPLGHGTLQAGPQSWRVHCPEPLAAGRRIKVIGIEGDVLKVIPLDD